jgi:hypothetical protein
VEESDWVMGVMNVGLTCVESFFFFKQKRKKKKKKKKGLEMRRRVIYVGVSS